MLRSACTLSLLLLCGTLTAAGAAPAATVFKGDSRLAEPVTLRQPMVPLSRALEEIGKLCGVALRADKELAAETVTLIASARPASAVLEQLATALGYTWAPEKGAKGEARYYLYEDQKARSRAAQLRTQARLALVPELEDSIRRIRQYEEKLRPMTRQEANAEMERMRSEMERRLQERPESGTSAERYEAEKDLSAAGLAREPGTTVLLGIYLGLPEPVRQRILLGERILVSTGRPQTQPLSPEAAAALRSAREFAAVRSSPGQRPPAVRHTEDEVVDFTTIVANGVLRLYGRSRRLGDHGSVPGLGIPVVQLTPARAHHGPPLEVSAPGQLTFDRPEDVQRSVRFRLPPAAVKKEDGLTYAAGLLPAEIVRALAEGEPSLRFCGDSYFKAVRPVKQAGGGIQVARAAFEQLAALSMQGRLTLEGLLKPLAERGSVNIHVGKDGWIRLRSTTYYVDREGSVDPELLERSFGPLLEGRRPTPERVMAATAGLTKAQGTVLSSPNLLFLSGHPAGRMLLNSRAGWQLVAQLSPRVRQDLLNGAALSYVQLAKPDQRAVEALFRALADEPGAAPIDLEVGPREAQALSLQLGPERKPPPLPAGVQPPPVGGDGSLRTLELQVAGYSYPLARVSLWAYWGAEPDPPVGK